MPRPVTRSLAAFAFLTLAASPAAAGGLSWGKPDVGYAEYRLDSNQCSNAAFDTKLTFDEIAHVARAAGAMSADLFSYARAREIVVHAATVTVEDQLQASVDRCLIDRGYTRFRLTAEQSRALARLKPGGEPRQHFLHRLASDGAVLSRQAVPTVRPPDGPAREVPPPREPPPILDFGPRPA
ncbi:MAG: hypothetical protein JOZ90_03075 [Alphaproteobacteria bacterium]|nr:hypothetical protein [Alphaproteobacteria bacterium]MBV9370571.1 hypothetical protein [Alphaproteobacteria bacterium]MBV9900061.1 hypothetical protein [Alphaproteobacteria bacterium]